MAMLSTDHCGRKAGTNHWYTTITNLACGINLAHVCWEKISMGIFVYKITTSTSCLCNYDIT